MTSEPVFITGKILNPNSDKNTVTIYINNILSGEQDAYVSLQVQYGMRNYWAWLQ